MKYLSTINDLINLLESNFRLNIRRMHNLLKKGSLIEAYKAYLEADRQLKSVANTIMNVILNDEEAAVCDIYIWEKHQLIPEDAYDELKSIIDANEIKKSNNRNKLLLNRFLECQKLITDAFSAYVQVRSEILMKCSKKA